MGLRRWPWRCPGRSCWSWSTSSSDDPLLLGLVAAARMLPVRRPLLGHRAAGRRDATRPDRRVTLVVRAGLMLAAAVPWPRTTSGWPSRRARSPWPSARRPIPPRWRRCPASRAPSDSRRPTCWSPSRWRPSSSGAALGGVLLHPATRSAAALAPSGDDTGRAAPHPPGVDAGPGADLGEGPRPSPSAALRDAPAALRAIAVMAAINFVLALVAVALLPMAVDTLVLRRGGLRAGHRSARLRRVRRPAAPAHRADP